MDFMKKKPESPQQTPVGGVYWHVVRDEIRTALKKLTKMLSIKANAQRFRWFKAKNWQIFDSVALDSVGIEKKEVLSTDCEKLNY